MANGMLTISLAAHWQIEEQGFGKALRRESVCVCVALVSKQAFLCMYIFVSVQSHAIRCTKKRDMENVLVQHLFILLLYGLHS